MRIPNGHEAFVNLYKLEEYCLSPEHPLGSNKAAVFWQVLGITVEDARWFSKVLKDVCACGEASMGIADKFGQRYILDFTMKTSTGSACVRSAWIIRSGEDFPRLTTCYVLRL